MVRITVHVLICPTVETLQCLGKTEIKVLQVDCPTDTLINIKNATIGNLADGICAEEGTSLCVLEQNTVDTIIRNPCQNKRTCNIQVPIAPHPLMPCEFTVVQQAGTPPVSATAMYVAHQCYSKCCVSNYSSRFKL